MENRIDLCRDVNDWIATVFPKISMTCGTSYVPNIELINSICEGKSAVVWEFVINHVRSRNDVATIKRKLRAYRVITDGNRLALNNRSELDDKGKIIRSLSTLLGRKRFLESTISDLGTKLLSFDETIKCLRQDIHSDKQTCSVLIMTYHLLNEKHTYFQLLFEDLQVRINSIKCQPASDIVHSKTHTPYNKHTESKFYTRTLNPRSHFDLINIFSCIKNTLHDIVEGLDPEFHLHKKEIWLKVRDLLNTYLADDLIMLLEKQCEENTSSLKSREDVCVLQRSLVSSELQKQMLCHISIFIDRQKFLNETNLLVEETKNISSEFQQTLANLQFEDQMLTQSVIECIMEAHCTEQSLEQLKGFIERKREETSILKKQNEDELSLIHDVHEHHVQICSKRNAMWEFLKQNFDLVFKSAKRHQNLQEFAKESIRKECDELGNLAQQLNDNMELERKLFFQTFKNVVNPMNFEYRIHTCPVDKQLRQMLGIEPYHSEDILLEKGIELKQFLHRKHSELNAREMTLAEMSSKSDMLDFSVNTELCKNTMSNLSETLKQLLTQVGSGTNQANNGEAVLENVRTAIRNWWEQPAQYIPSLTIENHTLKEWVDLLSIL